MRFKAQILGAVGTATISVPGKIKEQFIFSRSRIFFTKNHTETSYYIHIPLAFEFRNEANYTFDKVYDKDEKKRFRIVFTNGIHSSFIKLNGINRIKCNIVHKRYLFQRDPDWFWKTLIAAAIGAIFGFIGSGIGYRKGFQDGIKYTKPQSQDTSQKLPSKIH